MTGSKPSQTFSQAAKSGFKQADNKPAKIIKREETIKHVLHCNFGKNNIHLTLTGVIEDKNFQINYPTLSENDKVLYYMQLQERVKIHVSAGNVGFRKAQRGEYEAGYQVAAKMFQTMKQRDLLNKEVEIVMKNFGKGRAGFIDALMGKEGTSIRNKAVRLADKTPIKFGGVKAPRHRRL